MTDSRHGPAIPSGVQPRLALAGITKSYPGVVANSGLSAGLDGGAVTGIGHVC